MDQYLANRLTSLGVFQVVTDPKKADAIFTDGLGEAFEGRLAEWFPAPPVPAVLVSEASQAPAQVAVPAAPAVPAASTAPADPAPQPPSVPAVASPAADKQPFPQPSRSKVTEPEKRADTAADKPMVSSFRRSKGTLFLVDPRSRLVLWSVYAQPKNASGVEMDRTAGQIAKGIRQDLKGR
jgi:hypothetical protein